VKAVRQIRVPVSWHDIHTDFCTIKNVTERKVILIDWQTNRDNSK